MLSPGEAYLSCTMQGSCVMTFFVLNSQINFNCIHRKKKVHINVTTGAFFSFFLSGDFMCFKLYKWKEKKTKVGLFGPENKKKHFFNTNLCLDSDVAGQRTFVLPNFKFFPIRNFSLLLICPWSLLIMTRKCADMLSSKI